jgi:hypothetical protein
MNAPHEEPGREADPLTAYANGDPGAVRAAAPREPSDAEWEAARQRIHARLDAAGDPAAATSRWRTGAWLAGVGVLTAAAAAVAWAAITLNSPKVQNTPAGPAQAPGADVAAAPPHRPDHEAIAEFAVLPMAADDDVILHRVPGDGMLPVGRHPLEGAISLAGAQDVDLDDANRAWPSVTPAPGDIPMIFATKPR